MLIAYIESYQIIAGDRIRNRLKQGQELKQGLGQEIDRLMMV